MTTARLSFQQRSYAKCLVNASKGETSDIQP